MGYLLDLSSDFGWSVAELFEKLGMIEIRLHLVRRMTKDGYTFDPAKAKGEKGNDERAKAIDNFLAKARSSWQKG